MIAVCIDFGAGGASGASNLASPRFTATEQPYGAWLCQGEEVSVYYARLKPHVWPEHHHQQAELFFTLGAAEVAVTWRTPAGLLKKQLVTADQFCLIPPNVPHACDWKQEGDVVVVYLEQGLLKEEVHRSLSKVLVGNFRPLLRLDVCLRSLQNIFRELCHKAKRPSPSFIEGIGTALASRTLEQHFEINRRDVKTLPGLPERALEQVMEYIRGHLHETITVTDLARHAALSRHHFARLLKSSTGSSPLQFLLKCRVEKALELLRTGKFRVGEAACEVGFCDQSHLDRQCRKFFGFPPRTMMNAPASNSSLKIAGTSKIVGGM